MPTVKEKVSTLEQVLATFIRNTDRALYNLSSEMKEYKEEGQRQRAQSALEMKEFKNEMKDFKEEMRDFKDEMRDFKDESQRLRKDANKQWGHLANKMGTVVEDIIAPGIRPLIKEYFHDEVIDFSVNRNKKAYGEHGEFDVIAASNKSVYLVETKVSARESFLVDFETDIPKFRILFPEFSELKLVPMFAGLRFEQNFIDKATVKGFYVVAYREWEYLDIMNFEELTSS